ncbi:Ribosomal protein L6, chloroplast [Dillenia turbinata]|uniref:Ribosomal protein L6, chloroplast n=1 Tax=Dillenia turbinata TaxID=194707 RepID=A0AAN8W143_9MAGN
MWTSAISGLRIDVAVVPVPNSSTTLKRMVGKGVIQCSSRPKKKVTSHHMKTRPKKTQPYDVNRKPTVYPPLPPLPPDWTLLTPAAAQPDGNS